VPCFHFVAALNEFGMSRLLNALVSRNVRFAYFLQLRTRVRVSLPTLVHTERCAHEPLNLPILLK
jgi:hypothetical protein